MTYKCHMTSRCQQAGVTAVLFIILIQKHTEAISDSLPQVSEIYTAVTVFFI